MAETDPIAAEKLANIKENQKQATQRSKAKMAELAKTDPEIASRLEAQHQHHLEYCSCVSITLIEYFYQVLNRKTEYKLYR